MGEKQSELSRNQLQDVIDFSQGLAMVDRMSPFTQYSLMNDLNNNPRIPKMDALKKALSNYKENAKSLQSYMEFMKRWDMIFARTLQSYVNVLSFDLQVFPDRELTAQQYNSEEFQKDKERVYKFLDAFDYKAEFRKALMQVMTNEVAYYWFRRTKWNNKGMKGTLQLMPQEYCMLTNYWEKGLLYDSY